MKQLTIITPVTRPEHLPVIEESIRIAKARTTSLLISWWQSWAHFMDCEESASMSDGLSIRKTKAKLPGIGGTAERNDVLDKLAHEGYDGHVCFLDDDNLMLGGYLLAVEDLMDKMPYFGYFFDQVNIDGSPRCIARPENVRPCSIDTAQGCIPAKMIGDSRWNVNSSVNDGEFYQEVFLRNPFKFGFVNRPLCVYNALA